MSAVAITRTVALPRGASALERGTIRVADAVTRWATARAERRQERHEAMLAAIQAEQTTKADPRAADRMLAQMGLSGR
ncbi:hypothetical protein [Microbacterium tenebrionis]|uniref:Uncharacterized protein n=1 Tax=Microbacterium tenebrionis TaxID=2830665 RepID=A0A9X1S117_9MICO|nr:MULTISPECIES: hypothetical protein [Microbacterium]MCC2029790.1 hypothetical protein [Microbacterium tenebrionis]